MPSERQEVGAALFKGKIYVIGGYDAGRQSTTTVDVYNPAANRWTTVQPIPIANNHNAAAVAAGKLYSFGGEGNKTFVYDPVNNFWSEVAPSLSGHRSPAVGVINDKIYVAGGGGNGLEVYDPIANTWTHRASMKIARNHNPGAVINGKLYVAGGRGTPAAETSLEMYDPQSDAWTTLAPMPTGRSGGAAAVVHGELYVMGGEGVLGTYPHVEVYNPNTDSWRRIRDMQVPRHGISGPVIGNKIYVPAGAFEPDISPTFFNDVFVVTSTATFANISTRLKVGTGDNVLIGGFIVSGAASKRIVVRAIGPSLPLAGALANPRLELYDAAGLIAANDNWKDAPNKQEIIDSALAPTQDSEAAILTTVTPGNYTAVVPGAGGSTGVAVVEVYDLEAGSDSSLANISTRGFVQTGDDILIAGMIFDGQLSRRTMVRAIGPTLGRPDALADPKLELRDANGGLVAENDNWQDAPNKQEIIDTTIPPKNNSESAILQTLPPARYTAIVRGVNNTIGLALVEAYALE